MRQPPRQPPRQQPKPAARAAPKAAPKAAPRAGPKPGVKATQGRQASNLRAAQHARDAQRAGQQGARTGQSSGPQRGSRQGSPGRPLRGWRSWWATHEMDRRQRGRRVAHSQVGGGFTILRNWGAGRVTAILTLLLLALFTAAIALGAQSFVAAIAAFLFLGGALAIATAMQAQRFYSDSPPDTGPPLEKIADLRIDDLKIDEEDDSEVNSMDALDRTFEKDSDESERAGSKDRSSPGEESVATATPESLSSQDSAAPDTANSAAATDLAGEDAPADPSATDDAVSETAPENGAGESTASESDGTTAETARSSGEPEPQHNAAASPTSRVFVAGPADNTAAPESVADDASGAPVIPQQRDATSQENVAQENAASEAPAEAPGDNDATPDAAGVETDASASPATEADAEQAPTDDESETDAPHEDAAEAAYSDAGASTALSLLAAETPGTNLLAAYTAGTTSVPPETVRDVAATLIVSNLDRSIMFYTELLGLVEIDRAPDAVLLEAGFGRVLLWRRDDAPGAGDPVMHLTFEVGDIDKAYQSLSTKGVRFTHAPVSALSGEVHDLRAASFLDPDGHGLAITQLREH